jgi:hypothetical protein
VEASGGAQPKSPALPKKSALGILKNSFQNKK